MTKVSVVSRHKQKSKPVKRRSSRRKSVHSKGKRRVNKVRKSPRVTKKKKDPVDTSAKPTDSSSDTTTSDSKPSDGTKTSHWFRNLLLFFVVILVVVVVVLVLRLKGPSTLLYPETNGQDTTTSPASSGPGTGAIVILVLFVIGGLAYAAFRFRSKIATAAGSAMSSVKDRMNQAENKMSRDKSQESERMDSTKVEI